MPPQPATIAFFQPHSIFLPLYLDQFYLLFFKIYRLLVYQNMSTSFLFLIFILDLTPNLSEVNLLDYLANVLAKAIKKTKVVHSVADLKILSFDVSHWPGIANATGTVTIKPNDNKTNKPVNICITASIYFSPNLFYMVMLYNIIS